MVRILRSLDRTLVLERENPKERDGGILDPGVFTGKNALHILREPGTDLWVFKYDHGVVPPNLRNKYTSFNIAKEQAEIYFKTKKIKIVDVKEDL